MGGSALSPGGWAWCWLGLCLLLAGGNVTPRAWALDPARPLAQYPSRLWRSADGLPQDSVLRALPTRDGYLWAATEEGLARFDGVRFTVLDTRTRPEMPANLVLALAEDARGRLWFGTSAGLGCLETDGRIRTWTVADGLPNATVGHLAVDPTGDALWVGTRGGLARMTFADGRFEVFRQADGLGDNAVWALGCDRTGRVWVGTTGGLSVREPGGGGRFRRFTQEDGLPRNVVVAVAEDANGGIWVGTGGGLARREGERFVFVPTTEDGRGEFVSSLHGDREGFLWIGGDSAVRRLRVADGRLEHLPAESRGPGQSCYDIQEDREGNVWLALYAEGALVQLRDGRFSNLTPRDGLPAPYVWSLATDGSGTLWAGTAGGLGRFRDGQRLGLDVPERRARAAVHVLCVDRREPGGVWFATRDQELGHATADGRTEWFDGLPLEVNCLWQDAAGDLWAGTSEGLRRWRGGRLEPPPPDSALAAVAGLNLKTTLTDRAGNLWLGTRTEGVVRLAPDGQVTRWGSTEDRVLDQVMVFHEDVENGCLWIGTLGGGLLRWRDGVLRACTERDGLFDRNVFWLEEDAAGDFWMTCNRGLFRVPKRQLHDWAEGRRARVECAAYTTADGLCSAEGNGGGSPSGCRTPDGRLWFATPKGAIVVEPDRTDGAAPAADPPAVRVETVLANGRDLRAPLSGSGLTLPPGTERLEFAYTAPTFRAAERVRFRCRLDPLDRDWVETDTRRAAYYTRPAPGAHRFQVQARRPEGDWGPAATLAVTLRPRFFQTGWFQGAAAGALLAAVGAAGWGWHRLRLARVAARLRQAHACVLAERGRISREIHDTLTQGFVGIRSQLQAAALALPSDGAVPGEVRRHLAVAQRMAQHSVTEARRSMAELRADVLEHRDLPAALLGEVEALRTDATSPGTSRAEFRVEGVPRRLPDAVEHALLRVAQETLANAAKHAGAGRVEVRLVYGPGETRLEVADNGRGFDARRAFSPLDGHFGLLGMRERAAALGGRLDLQSAPGAGTQIAVTLPTAGEPATNGSGPFPR